MRVIGKKAVGKTLFTGVGFFLACLAFLIVMSSQFQLGDKTGTGDIALKVMQAKHDGERAQVFVDYSAKYSLQYALLTAGKVGGRTDATCGMYVFPLWYSSRGACPPQPEEVIKAHFNDRFGLYLSQYPGMPVDAHSLTLRSEDAFIGSPALGPRQTEKRVTVIGLSQQSLQIPLVGNARGTSASAVPKKAEVAAGLLFPVATAQPSISSCYDIRDVAGSTNHKGIDIAVAQDTPVVVIAPGEVVKVCNEWVGACQCSIEPAARNPCPDMAACKDKCGGGYGNNVIIKHAANLYSRYSHLDIVNVRLGDRVAAGQAIGLVGSTGRSFGYHLDFRIYTKGATDADFGSGSGENPFCFYPEEVLQTLNPTGESCKNSIKDKLISKDSPKVSQDCARVDISALGNLGMIEKTAIETEKTKEVSSQGSIKPAVAQKINLYQESIDRYGVRFGVDPNLIKAVITHESKGDPSAGSAAKAQGLMQVVPDNHYKRCEKVCSFTSLNDFWDPDKNICCGTSYLAENYNPKPKTYGECCNKLGCVRESREYSGWERSLRAYNGWGCGVWGDTNYVETVMKYYYEWGGQTIAPAQVYDDQIGVFGMRTNFKASYPYDMSMYDALSTFVQFEITDQYKTDSVSTQPDPAANDPEKFLAGRLDEFNKAHDGVVLKRWCDVTLFYDIVEQYEDCELSLTDGCACTITVHPELDSRDYEIGFSGNIISLLKIGGKDVYSPNIEAPFAVDSFQNADATMVQSDIILKLQYGSDGKYAGTTISAANLLGGPAADPLKFSLYKKKTGDKTVLAVTFRQGLPACEVKKRYYSLCAESPTTVPVVEEDQLMATPVRIRFSVELVPTGVSSAGEPERVPLPSETLLPPPRTSQATTPSTPVLGLSVTGSAFPEAITADAAALEPGLVAFFISQRSYPRTDPSVKYIVLHHTGGNTAKAAFDTWKTSEASAHYVVDRDGTVILAVPESRSAWHAGCSNKAEGVCIIQNMNQRSIGIEIVNCGAGTPKNNCGDGKKAAWGIDPYPPAQVAAVDRLVNYLMKKYHIPSENIIGHGCVVRDRDAREPAGFNPPAGATWTVHRFGESSLCLA